MGVCAVRLRLLVLACLLLPCSALHAEQWLTIEDVTATIEVPPDDIFRGEEPPARALKVVAEGIDESWAPGIKTGHATLLLLLGPERDPIEAVGGFTGYKTVSDEPMRVTVRGWFPLPADRSLLEEAKVRVAITRYREITAEFTFEPDNDGWEFPLVARTGWMTAEILGIGIGEPMKTARVKTAWLLGGIARPWGAPELAEPQEPELFAQAVITWLLPENVITSLGLDLDFGERTLDNHGAGSHRRLLEQLPYEGLERRVVDTTFSHYDVEEDFVPLSELPEIEAITLRVTRKVPLTEDWAPLTVREAE